MAGAGPFMVMKYSLSLKSGCSRWREGGGWVCVAQDIELPLPHRDTLNAPSWEWITNRSKDYWGIAWNLLQWCIIQSKILQIPILFLKTCTVIKYQKRVLISFKLMFEPKQQWCFFPAVMSEGRGQRPLCDLPAPSREKESVDCCRSSQYTKVQW